MRALQALFALCVLTSPALASAQQFRRPVACDTCIANWFYKDHDASGGQQDWNCGSSTYDGHRGSDFSLRGGMSAIDAGHDIVAVAGGTVVTAMDGNYDRCTSCPAAGADPRCGLGFGGGFGNYVAIDHGGGIRTYYGHMRQGSVRVSVGDTVTCGQVIGQIGSSGCTTGAHLHFEPRSGGTAFDPFAGSCSPIASRWTDQGPHRGLPGPTCDGASACPSGWFNVWTCSGTQRRRCIDGMQMTDECGPGRCVSRPTGVDDVCDADNDGVATDEGDCDDHNGAVRPGAMEVCSNGLDDDCSGGDAGCLDARFVGQSTDAPADTTGEAQFTACAGAPITFQFEMENTGGVAWSDINDLSPRGFGGAVRLGVPSDMNDAFVGVSRMSLNDTTTSTVPPGGRVTFVFHGTTPTTLGVQRTTWRLVDESRTWFGPELWLSFRITQCATPDASSVRDASVDARGLDANVDARGPDAGHAPSLRGDCGCHVARRQPSTLLVLTGLSGLALALWRRRQARRSCSQTSRRLRSPCDRT